MQLTIIASNNNQLANKQINGLLAGQRIVGCADSKLRLAGGRTLTITNGGNGIVDSYAATRAFEQTIQTARFRTTMSKFGHYATIVLAVAVTDENGDRQEHDICHFDHYGNTTTVNVDETTSNN
jgi:hypothetical protein